MLCVSNEITDELLLLNGLGWPACPVAHIEIIFRQQNKWVGSLEMNQVVLKK
jgi:hypothetical protein